MRFYFSEVDVYLTFGELMTGIIGGIAVVAVPLIFKCLLNLI